MSTSTTTTVETTEYTYDRSPVVGYKDQRLVKKVKTTVTTHETPNLGGMTYTVVNGETVARAVNTSKDPS